MMMIPYMITDNIYRTNPKDSVPGIKVMEIVETHGVVH